jgi:broad specificity phosphatase PhoE
MRIIFVRHGETDNNLHFINENSLETYHKLRIHDPLLTEKGINHSRKLGEYLKTFNIPIYKIFSSPFTRALDTLNQIKDYVGDSIHYELMIDLYEKGGYFDVNDIVYSPTINDIHNKYTFLDFNSFKEKNKELDINKPWYNKLQKENDEEYNERTKELIKKLKCLAVEEEYQDKTIIIIGHFFLICKIIGKLFGLEHSDTDESKYILIKEHIH